MNAFHMKDGNLNKYIPMNQINLFPKNEWSHEKSFTLPRLEIKSREVKKAKKSFFQTTMCSYMNKNKERTPLLTRKCKEQKQLIKNRNWKWSPRCEPSLENLKWQETSCNSGFVSKKQRTKSTFEKITNMNVLLNKLKYDSSKDFDKKVSFQYEEKEEFDSSSSKLHLPSLKIQNMKGDKLYLQLYYSSKTEEMNIPTLHNIHFNSVYNYFPASKIKRKHKKEVLPEVKIKFPVPYLFRKTESKVKAIQKFYIDKTKHDNLIPYLNIPFMGYLSSQDMSEYSSFISNQLSPRDSADSKEKDSLIVPYQISTLKAYSIVPERKEKLLSNDSELSEEKKQLNNQEKEISFNVDEPTNKKDMVLDQTEPNIEPPIIGEKSDDQEKFFTKTDHDNKVELSIKRKKLHEEEELLTEQRKDEVIEELLVKKVKGQNIEQKPLIHEEKDEVIEELLVKKVKGQNIEQKPLIKEEKGQNIKEELLIKEEKHKVIEEFLVKEEKGQNIEKPLIEQGKEEVIEELLIKEVKK